MLSKVRVIATLDVRGGLGFVGSVGDYIQFKVILLYMKYIIFLI